MIIIHIIIIIKVSYGSANTRSKITGGLGSRTLRTFRDLAQLRYGVGSSAPPSISTIVITVSTKLSAEAKSVLANSIDAIIRDDEAVRRIRLCSGVEFFQDGNGRKYSLGSEEIQEVRLVEFCSDSNEVLEMFLWLDINVSWIGPTKVCPENQRIVVFNALKNCSKQIEGC